MIVQSHNNQHNHNISAVASSSSTSRGDHLTLLYVYAVVSYIFTAPSICTDDVDALLSILLVGWQAENVSPHLFLLRSTQTIYGWFSFDTIPYKMLPITLNSNTSSNNPQLRYSPNYTHTHPHTHTPHTHAHPHTHTPSHPHTHTHTHTHYTW